MKNKIINIITDIFLIMIVFSLTDFLMLKVFCTKKILPELLVYLVVYGIVFGAKGLVLHLWKKSKR